MQSYVLQNEMSGIKPRRLLVVDRGCEEYEHSMLHQSRLLRQRLDDPNLGDILLLLEHSEVFTYGRSSVDDVSFLRSSALAGELASELPTLAYVKWIEANRGGMITFHGPGQLIGYPIFFMERHGRDVHLFLRKIEAALIRALGSFGVYASSRRGLTGVWVQIDSDIDPCDLCSAETSTLWRKIASIGIGVKRWVSYHGFALNVDPDMRFFQAIMPCGQDSQVMTSLKEVCLRLGIPMPSMTSVKESVTHAFEEEFGFDSGLSSHAPMRSKPSWLKIRYGAQEHFSRTQSIVKSNRLVTVCEEARCPNIGECWSRRTATFMIMGDLCTRRCGFCSVKDGTLQNLLPLDPFEPLRVAQATKELGLKSVVITSVDRDDLEDMGARHFDQTVRALIHQVPNLTVELLIPDLQGKRPLLETILSSGNVSILGHNIETVPGLYSRVRPGARFRRSLDVLQWAKEIQPSVRTKTGIMVGLGEDLRSVLNTMDELRDVGCDVLTIGQYLQPTPKQLPVVRYVTPEEFALMKDEGLKRGFLRVESAPFVRSSYVGPE